VFHSIKKDGRAVKSVQHFPDGSEEVKFNAPLLGSRNVSDSSGWGDALIYDPTRSFVELNMDDYIDPNGRVNMIPRDVRASDMLGLQGMREMLQRFRGLYDTAQTDAMERRLEDFDINRLRPLHLQGSEPTPSNFQESRFRQLNLDNLELDDLRLPHIDEEE
jgi:hypothetical protein